MTLLLLLLSLQNDLQAERDRARPLPKPATVVLRGGTYFLPETLVFKAEDSDVTYAAAANEKVVVSGGRRITGWKVEGELWTVKTDLRFNQLFIDGKRRTRARTPNEGSFFTVDGEITLDKPAKLKYREGDLRAEWAERGDV